MRFGVGLKGFADLNGQLTRRRKNQGLGCLLLEVNIGHQGQRKSRRLAGTRLSQPQDIPVFQKGTYGLGLNGRGLFITQFGECFTQAFRKPPVH